MYVSDRVGLVVAWATGWLPRANHDSGCLVAELLEKKRKEKHYCLGNNSENVQGVSRLFFLFLVRHHVLNCEYLSSYLSHVWMYVPRRSDCCV